MSSMSTRSSRGTHSTSSSSSSSSSNSSSDSVSSQTAHARRSNKRKSRGKATHSPSNTDSDISGSTRSTEVDEHKYDDGDDIEQEPEHTDAAGSEINVDVDSIHDQIQIFEATVRSRFKSGQQRELSDQEAVPNAFREAIAAIRLLAPPTGARRAHVQVLQHRTSFLLSSEAQRLSACTNFLDVCKTGNYADFIDDVMSGRNPKLSWDDTLSASGSGISDDEQNSDADEDDDVDSDLEESASKRVRGNPSSSSAPASASSSVAPASSSSISTSSTSSTNVRTRSLTSSISPTVVSCSFTFDNYVNMCSAPESMLLPCVMSGCPLTRADHPKSRFGSETFKMPSPNPFPCFRDPSDDTMSDPFEFLVKLERLLKLYNVPSTQWGPVLVSCLPNRQMQEWVESNILMTCTSWEAVKMQFKMKYDDPQFRNRLMEKLGDCTQRFTERAHEYTERFNALVVRVSAGAAVDTQRNIIDCERGFIPELRKELSQFRARKTTNLSRPFEFASLNELYETASALEQGMQARPGRVTASQKQSEKKPRESKKKKITIASVRQSDPSGAAANPAASASAGSVSVNKIEVNADGKPINVNKKHTHRGGRGGRGSSRGRGSRSNSTGRGDSNSGGSGAFSSRGGAQSRGGMRGGAAGTATFNGNCFRCKQFGHRIENCPEKGQADE